MFAADQSQWFYDHDFLESTYFETTTNLPTALANCSFASSFVQEVSFEYTARSLPPANAAILVFGSAIRHPRSAASEHYQLVYLGRFSCESRAQLKP